MAAIGSPTWCEGPIRPWGTFPAGGCREAPAKRSGTLTGCRRPARTATHSAISAMADVARPPKDACRTDAPHMGML